MADRLQYLNITKEKEHFPGKHRMKAEIGIKHSQIFEIGGKVVDTTNTENWIEIEILPEEAELLQKMWDRLEASYKEE